MNDQPFNNSFNVLARVQAKPGHVVRVNGKRHRGATNLSLACFGRPHEWHLDHDKALRHLAFHLGAGLG
jgi:hypothetical protein